MARKIPPPVWRECHKLLDMYELKKKALVDLKSEIMDEYAGRNQILGREEKGRILQEPAIGGGGSINHTKLDTAIYKLTGTEIMELEKEIQQIEDVYNNLTPQQQQFFDLHYRKHLNVVECHMRMGYCRKRAHDFKREVIEKTAVRLGYIR